MHSLVLFAGGNAPIKLMTLENFEDTMPNKKESKVKAKRGKDGKGSKRKASNQTDGFP